MNTHRGRWIALFALLGALIVAVVVLTVVVVTTAQRQADADEHARFVEICDGMYSRATDLQAWTVCMDGLRGENR